MSFKAVVTFYVPGVVPTYDELLIKLGAEVQKTFCTTEEELITACSEADAIMALGIRITPGYVFSPKVIENLNKCRLIALTGIGYDNVDIAAATEKGICVANNPYYCLEEVSDHAMALILACTRKFYQLLPDVKSGKWSTQPDYLSALKPLHRLSGQTLGLIGFGNIARALVPKAKIFGFRIIAYSPHVPPVWFRTLKVESVELDQLLEESDFVSLHTALTSETRHMMGLEQFKRMKRTAYFVNTARGELVDEKALYAALSEGLIAGAGLDVLESEPPDRDNPLLKLSNVLVTGHFAYYSEESREELFRWPWEEVARVLHGEWPQGLVNPQVKRRFSARWGACHE
ncbi:MAG TPA: C-terminal binding protein [Dehalococcoidia bacterium]|nr:C-terminal binding protein [Dehalococcoidia bacterium]